MVLAATQTAGVTTNEHGNEEVQVVEFIIGDDKFAVNLFDVKEIVEASKITPLPHAPAYIRGIIDLRGEITTIVDLRQLLKITKGKSGDTEDLRFIVLDESVTDGKTGVVVDEVTSVLTVNVADIDQTSGLLPPLSQLNKRTTTLSLSFAPFNRPCGI